jgi:hypothetical protein
MREFIKRNDYREDEERFRPTRQIAINEEDIFNLRLALELSNDVQDLLQDPHIFENKQS